MRSVAFHGRSWPPLSSTKTWTTKYFGRDTTLFFQQDERAFHSARCSLNFWPQASAFAQQALLSQKRDRDKCQISQQCCLATEGWAQRCNWLIPPVSLAVGAPTRHKAALIEAHNRRSVALPHFVRFGARDMCACYAPAKFGILRMALTRCPMDAVAKRVASKKKFTTSFVFFHRPPPLLWLTGNVFICLEGKRQAVDQNVPSTIFGEGQCGERGISSRGQTEDHVSNY